MDNTTTNVTSVPPIISTENDFFKELYSDSDLRQATMTIFYTGSLLGLMLEFGIIWYERGGGNQRYRTAINQLFSTMSWIVVSYIIFVYIPQGIRYHVGPLNPTFCDLQTFLKNFFASSFVLTLDLISLLRYVFIFKLSNFAMINDDLIARFLQITVLLLSIWIAAVNRMSVGRMQLTYLMCAGTDPSKEHIGNHPDTIIRKFETVGILVVASVMLNACIFIKIFLYQRKIEQSTQSIELGRMTPYQTDSEYVSWTNPNKDTTTSNVPKSMVDLTTQILCLLFQGTFVAIALVRYGFEPLALNKYEHRWMTYYMQIIGPAIAILGISIIYYIKNNSVPKAIWRSINEKIRY